MPNFFSDNEDLQFHFERGIDWGPLVQATERGFRSPEGPKTTEEAVSGYRDLLSMVGELVAKEVAPRAAQIDREGAWMEGGEGKLGPSLDHIFELFKSAELHRLCLPRELGGLNAPLLTYFLGGEMIARADVSTMAHFSFHGGMAMAMLAFSIQEGSTRVDPATGQIQSTRFQSYIEDVASGNAWGSMDITEPNAGSDMAQLRARAVQDASGTWRLTGQKIFITSGHGKYHFVIARTEDAKDPHDPFSGLGGLSMFLVKAYDDLPNGQRERHVTLERLEEKCGHHGSVTASLSFDGAPAELIGERGEGFKYMLTLMNNARVGVGFESIGLAESALRLAVAYASERRTMGKAIREHEMIADYLDEMQTDIQALRALAVRAGYCEELAQKLRFFSGSGSEEAARTAKKMKHISRRLTPLLKYLAAEKAVEISRRALQIHGGVGYTKEFGVERLVRDALVMPIYEGTSQIQSLMAMKDVLGGIAQRPRAFASNMAEATLRSRAARDPLERRVARIQTLSFAAQRHLVTRTATDKLRTLPGTPVSGWPAALTKNWDPKRDFSLAMLHAERLTKLLADEAILEILQGDARRHPERRDLLERYLDRAEPRCRALHDEITTTGRRILSDIAGARKDLPAAAE